MNLMNTQFKAMFNKHLSSFISWLLKHQESITIVILFILSYGVFLFRLHLPTIRMWDESRLAVNSLEMLINGNFLVTHFDGKPDMWNTKPPLLIWLMVASMKIFGVNEFALRFPSAISGIATTFILLKFCNNYFQNIKIGLVSALVLITSIGFVGEHVGRTGDYDALLVLWIVIYSLSYFSYLHSDIPKKRSLYLVLTTIALVLAVLTKSIAGLMFLPGLLIYTAWRRKIRKILFARESYLAATFFILAVSSYYLLRNYYNPGYIKSVLQIEVTGRYLSSLENHKGEFIFYLKGLFNSKFIPWIYFLPACFILTQMSAIAQVKELSLFVSIQIICYLLIISSAQTKLPWYDAPLYPMMSLLIGLGVAEFLQSLANYYTISNKNLKVAFSALMIIVLFSLPYLDMLYLKIYTHQGMIYDWSKKNDPQLMYGSYFKQLQQEQPTLKKFYVANNDDYNAHLLFYTKKYNHFNNNEINVLPAKHSFMAGDIVVSCNPEVKQYLKHKYKYKLNLLHTNGFCQTNSIGL